MKPLLLAAVLFSAPTFVAEAFDWTPKSSAEELAAFVSRAREAGENALADRVAALKAGVRRAYVHESWLADARKRLDPSIEVVPLKIGVPVEVGGIRFTSCPANHATRLPGEQTTMYFVEKGETRPWRGHCTGLKRKSRNPSRIRFVRPLTDLRSSCDSCRGI